jgi:CRP/FNR family transcriptional regulator
LLENRYIALLDASAMELIATAAHPAPLHAAQHPLAFSHSSTS